MSSLSIGSLFNNTTSISSSNAQKLEGTLQNNDSNTSDEQLMEVCKSFESYFVEQVISEMKKTISTDDSDYMQYFGDILTQEYSTAITEQSDLGLAKQLYESMKRQ